MKIVNSWKKEYQKGHSIESDIMIVVSVVPEVNVCITKRNLPRHQWARLLNVVINDGGPWK